MTDFDAWTTWALAEPDPSWPNAARQAAVPARYEDPSAGQSYRDALGGAAPRSRDAYHAVAEDHCLRGAVLPAEHAPGALTRCLKLASLERQLASAGWSSVDPSYRLADAVPATLTALASLVPDPIEVRAAYEKARSVFVTFEEHPLESAPAPAGSKPPKVLAWEKGRAGESAADTAVYRLALTPRPRCDLECAPWVVLHYAQSSCGALRIPVPADGGLHERFRALEAGSPARYGRTCAGWGADPCDAAGSEPELVHENGPMPGAAIFVASLGRTTTARPLLP